MNNASSWTAIYNIGVYDDRVDFVNILYNRYGTELFQGEDVFRHMGFLQYRLVRIRHIYGPVRQVGPRYSTVRDRYHGIRNMDRTGT